MSGLLWQPLPEPPLVLRCACKKALRIIATFPESKLKLILVMSPFAALIRVLH